MKKNITKIAIVSILTTASMGTLTGCVGSNAVTSKAMKFNIEAVDNRYARGGLNVLLSPVYALSVAADTIVFNSVEFWMGEKSILRGKKEEEKVNFYMGGKFVTTVSINELEQYAINS